MSTDGEGTISSVAQPTYGKEQERKRQNLKVEALNKINFHLVSVMTESICLWFLMRVYIASLLEAHPDLLYLLPLNNMINTLQALTI